MKSFFIMIISIFLLSVTMVSAEITWIDRTVSGDFNGASSIYAADIDLDGLIDIAGSAVLGDRIAWWHNDGGNPVQWTEHFVDTAFAGAIFVHCADIDGDILPDIIGCAWDGNEIAWWRNEGGNPVHWTKQILDASFNHAHEANASDIDNDGDLDIIGASAGNNEIAWWRNDGGSPIQWVKNVIDGAFSGARSVRAADFDADGDVDIAGAALTANAIEVWYNNFGGDSAWTHQVVDNALTYAHMTSPSDIDGDGDIDLAGEGYGASTLFWWRNEGGFPVQWTKHSLGGYFPNCLGVSVSDLDSDGHADILGTSDSQDDVAWWRNSGGDSIVWTKQVIDGAFDGAWPVRAADIDDDGDADVISAAYYAGDIAWYENLPTGIEEGAITPTVQHKKSPTIVHEISLPQKQGACKVLDITGRAVKPDRIIPGVYFVEIDGQIIQKIVKVR